ncbi:MAG TPA: hypothetical protein VK474_08990 [Chthoniobacterales bacterium]|nr:hypothetical protein [Chthoniobacterales bacterium]
MHVRPGTVLRFIGPHARDRVEEAKNELRGKHRQISPTSIKVTDPIVLPFQFWSGAPARTQETASTS